MIAGNVQWDEIDEQMEREARAIKGSMRSSVRPNRGMHETEAPKRADRGHRELKPSPRKRRMSLGELLAANR